jgi:hypothetical protein
MKDWLDDLEYYRIALCQEWRGKMKGDDKDNVPD